MNVSNRIINIIGGFVVITIIGIYIFNNYGKNNSEAKDESYLRDSKLKKGIISTVYFKDTSCRELFKEGFELQEKGDLNKAESVYTLFVNKYPAEPEGFHGLGTTLTYAEKYNEAKKCYNQAIALDSNRAKSFSSLGAVAAYQDSHELAIEFYKIALDLEPNQALAHYGLASNYIFVDSFDSAIIHYKNVIKLIPNSIYAKRSKASIKKINKYLKE